MSVASKLILLGAGMLNVIALVQAGRWPHPLALRRIVMLVALTVFAQMLAYYSGKADAR